MPTVSIQNLRNIMLSYKSNKLNERALQDELKNYIYFQEDQRLKNFLEGQEQELEDMAYMVSEKQKRYTTLKIIQAIETFIQDYEY